MDVLHMSTCVAAPLAPQPPLVVLASAHGPLCARTNTTGRYRISCDTRWQPATEAADERWATEEGWRRQLDPARLKERGEEGATEVRK